MKKERIDEKIEQIEQFIEQLYSIFPEEFDEYKNDFKIKCTSERLFEKIIEACVDLAFLTIRYKKLKMPEDDESSFIILNENKIISENLATNLRIAKGMRNIIVHEYGKIDDIKVFNSIKDELQKDVEEFIKCVELALK